MADQPVTTSIDSLIKYLSENGETDSFVLARKLGVNEDTIREWVDVLEKAGMIKVSYKVGKMFLSPASAEKVIDLKATKNIDEAKKSGMLAELSMQESMVKDIAKKIDSYGKTAADAEKAFREKKKDTKDALDRLTRLEEEVDRTFNTVSGKKEAVGRYVEELRKELDSLKATSVKVSDFSLDSSGATTLIEDIKRKAETFRSNINELRTEFESGITEYKKTVKAMEDHAAQEIKTLQQIAIKQQEELRRYDRVIANYKRKEDEIKHRSERTSKFLLDDALKAQTEVDRLYGVADGEIKSTKVMIANMKAGWGGLAEFNDKLTAIKKGIAEISKENAAIRQEMDAIKEEARKLEADSKLKPMEKSARMNALNKRSKDVFSRLTQNDRKKDQVGKDVTNLTK